jgi:excisionase family DNA binding protein
VTNVNGKSISEREAQRRQNQRTLSVTQAAEKLGVSRNLAYEAIKAGQIPHIRIGRRILVPEAALERLLSGGV